MASSHWRTVGIGALSGILVFLTALLPGSRLWILLWPVLGAALAVHLATSNKNRWGHHAGTSVAIGMIAGMVFLVLGMGAALAIGTVESSMTLAGAARGSQRLTLDRSFATNIAVVAIGIIPFIAVAGGLIAQGARRIGPGSR